MPASKTNVSLKSLQSEVNIFMDELKATKDELNVVKKELKAATDEIKLLKEVKNPKTKRSGTENSENEIKCNKCDNAFRSRKSLKVHIAENHEKKITCKSCNKTFGKNSNLEIHVKEKRDSSFLLKWRLSKHQEIHDNLSVKKCHYFNNKKFCLFEEIGCMFEHALSGNCKHGEKCSKSLCSFQHGEKCEI